MKSPSPYFGGKAKLTEQITACFPARMDCCVEPFCGMASVFFAAPARWAKQEILNDVNSDLINFLHVLRDQTEELCARLEITPHSREEYNLCWRALREHDFRDEVHRALCFFVVTAQSFGSTARINSWSLPNHHDADKATTWRNKTQREQLYVIARRLNQASLENYPAVKVIEIYDGPSTFFYCDPPYLNTHGEIATSYHGRDMSVEEHQELIQALLGLQGMALVNGYDHPIYDALEKSGWERVAIPRRTSIPLYKDFENDKRLEVLWINPALQKERRQLKLF